MQSRSFLITASMFLLVLFALTGFQPALSVAASIASLRNVSGTVDVLKGGATPGLPAKNDDQVSTGDLIRTKTRSFVEVVYHDGSVLKIAERSRVDIGEHFSGNNPGGSEVRLARGKLQAIVDLTKAKSGGSGPKKFEIRTPNAIAGVRGTNFVVNHQHGVTNVFVRSGQVYSFNPRIPTQMVNLLPGTVTTVTGNLAPLPPRAAQSQEIQKMEHGLTAPPAASGGDSGKSEASGSGSEKSESKGSSDKKSTVAADKKDAGAPESKDGGKPGKESTVAENKSSSEAKTAPDKGAVDLTTSTGSKPGTTTVDGTGSVATSSGSGNTQPSGTTASSAPLSAPTVSSVTTTGLPTTIVSSSAGSLDVSSSSIAAGSIATGSEAANNGSAVLSATPEVKSTVKAVPGANDTTVPAAGIIEASASGAPAPSISAIADKTATLTGDSPASYKAAGLTAEPGLTAMTPETATAAPAPTALPVTAPAASGAGNMAVPLTPSVQLSSMSTVFNTSTPILALPTIPTTVTATSSATGSTTTLNTILSTAGRDTSAVTNIAPVTTTTQTTTTGLTAAIPTATTPPAIVAPSTVNVKVNVNF